MDIISKIIYFVDDYDLLNSELIFFALFAGMACIVAGLTIWGVIATGNSIRGYINRDTEMQRAKKQKEIELIQAQIDYYNSQRGKGT